MGIALALLSAMSYGASDVIGGLASRRGWFVRAALLGQAGGFVASVVLMLVLVTPPMAGSDVVWGAGSGVGTGLGMVFLFRGMGRGSMSLVVPVSAVVGVAVPVIISVVVLGERPSWLTWVGVGIGIPALWLISRGTDGGGSVSRTSIVDGLAAGCGIAVQYVCLAQARSSSGLWPIVIGRVAALLTITVAVAFFMPRAGSPSRPVTRRWRSFSALSIGAGALAAAALTAYLYALRTEFVTVAVVLSSLYPAVPIVVGLVFLRERLRRRQMLGLVSALAATVTIAVA